MGVQVCAAVPVELGEVPGIALGVGPLAAGVAAATWLAGARPAAVVLIGTAGTYAGGPPIGAVVAADSLALASTAAALGLGYVPMGPGLLRADEALLGLSGLPRARVLTVNAITTDPPLAALYAREWEVEHMETYAVAYTCAKVGVPFVALLGITNHVGPEAHREWLANRDAAQKAAQAAALRLVQAWEARG